LDLTGLKDASFSGGWSRPNAGSGISVVDGEGINGEKAIQLKSNASSSQPYNLQLRSPNIPVENGKTYTLSFYIRSDEAGKGRIGFEKGSSDQYPSLDYGTGSTSTTFTTGTSWKNIRCNVKVNAGQLQINFELGYLPNVTYYVDVNNLVVVDSSVDSKPTAIEKPDAEKKQIIGEAFAYWITNMVGHYKNRVHAWDVVNEPINDAGTDIRYSAGDKKSNGEDIFYWQDFLGKDYAVTAFKLAREAGNPGDILFINDYNLEENIEKCKQLIEYVNYIEKAGQRVDGIGTQMHISIDTDTTDIAEMFRLLAATGKQIKISELDVKVNTASPDPAKLDEQAEMYYQVVKLYKEIIPANQQYGITVWCISDHEDEHTNWLSGDAPCIWDAKYERKMAYKRFVDGLTGKDASTGFSGE
jgi:GH35 family endo-1,4-beta-xylanase